MHVYDHREPTWHARYSRHGRQNGAATYSAEIVRYQVPLWSEMAPEAVVSTAPWLHTLRSLPQSPLYVQYLHMLPDWTKIRAVSARFSPILFVSAYKSAVLELQNRGYRAVWIPMTVDPDRLPAQTGQFGPRRIVYFGNLIGPKVDAFPSLRSLFRRFGWAMDTISEGKWNREPVQPSKVHSTVARYAYGIGVGRCALEMLSIGMPVLIYGKANGGIMQCPDDFSRQLSTNLNGDVHTGPLGLVECINGLSSSHVQTSSVHNRLPDIRKIIYQAVLG